MSIPMLPQYSNPIRNYLISVTNSLMALSRSQLVAFQTTLSDLFILVSVSA